MGTVAEVGPNVSDFSIGDRVIPMPGYPTDPKDEASVVMSASSSYAIRGLIEHGAYAEYMVVPARWTIKDNTTLSSAALATLPMTIVTAVRAVKVVGEVQKEQKVLILCRGHLERGRL